MNGLLYYNKAWQEVVALPSVIIFTTVLKFLLAVWGETVFSWKGLKSCVIFHWIHYGEDFEIQCYVVFPAESDT